MLSNEEINAEETAKEETINATENYPEWMKRLPNSVLEMVKKYGWLYGAHTAVGGAILMGFGIFFRIISYNFIFGNNRFNPYGDMSSGMNYVYDPFIEIKQKGWYGFSALTGFAIIIGLVTAIFGAVLAISLKRWGNKET